MTPPTIIPIAGGKGGVGKTLLTANLAIALAQFGHSTVAVDLDLGGSNLHSYLGISNNYRGIGDYLNNRSTSLLDLLVPTQVANLMFLPGDGRIPFMANLTYAQKSHLLDQLKMMEAEYILLDLGAGSSFNTLDFFGITSKGILVTTPELPAMMNLLMFLKSFLYRHIERVARKNFKIVGLLAERYNHPFSEMTSTMAALQTEIASLDPEIGKKVQHICEKYRPRIIFNMAEHPNELDMLSKLQSGLAQMSVEADFFGFIFRDGAVRKSFHEGRALLLHQQDNPVSLGILRIAKRIAHLWHKKLENSAELLKTNTLRLHQEDV